MAVLIDRLALNSCTLGCFQFRPVSEKRIIEGFSLKLISHQAITGAPSRSWRAGPDAFRGIGSRLSSVLPVSYPRSDFESVIGLDSQSQEDHRSEELSHIAREEKRWSAGSGTGDSEASTSAQQFGTADKERVCRKEGGGKVLRRRAWESQTGRKVRKTHSEPVSSILEALKTNLDMEDALELWKGKINVKEQSMLLDRQMQWDKALTIFSWLKQQRKYRPNVYVYNIMLKICGRARKWDLVRDLLSEMHSQNITPTNVTYSTLIDSYARAGHKEDALFWFDSMKEGGLQPDEVTVNTLINAYKKFGDVAEAEKLFHSLSRSDTAGGHAAIDKSQIKEDIPTQFKKPVSHGVVSEGECDLSIGETNRGIETFDRENPDLGGKEPFMPDEETQSKEATEKRVDPTGSVKPLQGTDTGFSSHPKNVDTYNTMMDLYARNGQSAEASKLFRNMMAAGVSPNTVTFNTMIHICGHAGRLEEAKAIFKKMGDVDCVPDVATYNTMIALYLKKGKKRLAHEYYERMREAGLVPDAVTFRTLLRNAMAGEAKVASGLGLSKQITSEMEELASALGEAMHKSEVTLTIMLNLYKKSGMIREASEVARRMRKAGLLTNLVSFNSVLEMSRSVTEATEIFELMQSKGIAPDILTYNCLAAILKKAGLLKDALKQIEAADSSGLPLSMHTLTTAASLYGHADMHEEALEACEALRTSGFVLDTAAYSAMIFAYGHAGHLHEALRISMEMQTKGLEPDVVTYTTVICVYARMGLLEGVSRVFKRMKRAGCEPDDIAYSVVIKSYRDAGREDLAAMVQHERQFARYVLEQNHRDDILTTEL